MRFLTATLSAVASLVVVLAMFSFAPVALADLWSDGYTQGRAVGIGVGKNACKTELSKCTSKDSVNSNSICKDCLPDGYFVTGAVGSAIRTIPGDDNSKAFIYAGDRNSKLLSWKGVTNEAKVPGGYITWGYFYWPTTNGKDNPEVFAKVYRHEADNWTNIEFFFVSVNTITVGSCMSIDNCKTVNNSSLTETGNDPAKEDKRFVQHHYEKDGTSSKKYFHPSDKKAAVPTKQTDDFGENQQQIGEFSGVKIKAATSEKPLDWIAGGEMESGSWGTFGTKDDAQVFVKFYKQSDGIVNVNFFHTTTIPVSVSSGRKSSTADEFLKASSDLGIDPDVLPAGVVSKRYSRHDYDSNK